MPNLQFKGKSFVQNHHLAVPYHQLVPSKGKSLTDKLSLHDSLIINGDNLLALKALLPTYAAKIKCIYIDPPYNTGNENWVYNDNVKSPIIKDWIGEVVGKEGDDLTRHDKWLCMMMPRIKLLKELLSDDGVFFVSIGDDELGNIIGLLNEIFGQEYLVAIYAWKSRSKPTNAGDAKFRPQKVFEYVVAFSKTLPDNLNFNISSISERKYPHKDKDGDYRITSILTSNRGSYRRDTMRFEINGYSPSELKRWKAGSEEIQGLFDTNRVDFKEGEPFRKHYKGDEEEQLYPLYTLVDPDISGTAENGKSEVNQILGSTHGFDTIKPVGLVKHLINMVLDKDGKNIILDSFAGTGTTAQAVLELNKEDGGSRKFILVEMEGYANSITAERVRRVIKGISKAKNKLTREGLGGTFSYFELGEPIETSSLLNGSKMPSYTELARYVFYTSTGEDFSDSRIDEKNNYVGKSSQYEVYLYYKPDVEYLKATALTLDEARRLRAKSGIKPLLVFAPTKYVEQTELDNLKITFCQLPFEMYKVKNNGAS